MEGYSEDDGLPILRFYGSATASNTFQRWHSQVEKDITRDSLNVKRSLDLLDEKENRVKELDREREKERVHFSQVKSLHFMPAAQKQKLLKQTLLRSGACNMDY